MKIFFGVSAVAKADAMLQDLEKGTNGGESSDSLKYWVFIGYLFV